ncbi:MAG: hypothetical protein Q4E90_01485 [Collinsella sp.]|nr:hypothetical protein [Collinsella sp.]
MSDWTTGAAPSGFAFTSIPSISSCCARPGLSAIECATISALPKS